MAFVFEDVLAGPIVRRIEPGLAAVWIALRKPASVELRLFQGATDARPQGTAQNDDRAIAAGRMDTIPVGKELHLALPKVVLAAAAGRLASDRLYGYDIGLRDRGAPGPRPGSARPRPAGRRPHDGRERPLRAGLPGGRLPAFLLPPTDIGRLQAC